MNELQRLYEEKEFTLRRWVESDPPTTKHVADNLRAWKKWLDRLRNLAHDGEAEA